MAAIQRLMGALCFARRAAQGRPSPYADLVGGDLWGCLAGDFVRQCCLLLGQAQDSPLLVTAAAGAAALPTLLKLAAVMGGQQQQQQQQGELAGASAAEQLPVEIPLGPEFVFHSIFACPVSRDQASEGALGGALGLRGRRVQKRVWFQTVINRATPPLPQSTPDNPPMLLPCGHCICQASILRIAKAPNRAFKCPYCPAECTPKDCTPLTFPDRR